MVKLGNVAAAFHARMCNDPRFGYTQGTGRWGASPTETWSSDGINGKFAIGDRDCSSSVIDVWREVLSNTPYAGCLDAATYTGNMRDVFTSTGLFEWMPADYPAQPGDIYLNEAKHTAMNQTSGLLSEFLINENGGIIGGQVGDQTGRESVVRNVYNFPWNGILHYNGKADFEGDDLDMNETDMRKLARMIAEENAAYGFGDDLKPNWDGYGASKKNGGCTRNNYNVARMVLASLNDIRAMLARIIAKLGA